MVFDFIVSKSYFFFPLYVLITRNLSSYSLYPFFFECISQVFIMGVLPYYNITKSFRSSFVSDIYICICVCDINIYCIYLYFVSDI